MPLKLVPPRQGKSPNWTIRGTYLGQHINRSAGTSRRAVAVKALKKIERDIESGEFSQPGEPTFASAARAYVDAGGELTYIRKLVEHFGDTPLGKIDQQAIDGAAMALYPDSSSATRNRQVYTPCGAVLHRAGISQKITRPRGANGNKATAWLWPEQAEAIFTEAEKLNKDFAALLIVLCYTGMRLSEALGLTWNDVRLQDEFAYLPETKNGEPRSVFLPPVAVAAIANLDRKGNRVFAFAKGGHLYSMLRVSAIRAKVDLPERSAFHIFRHTFMTWMRRYGGLDELGLLKLGTHQNRKSIARYTHVVFNEEAKRAMLLPTPKVKNG